MVQILQSAFIEALGWSLVDSLWQTGALWGLYCLVTLNGSKHNSSVRHNIAFGALVFSTILFFATLLVNYTNAIHGNHTYSFSYLINQPLQRTWGFFLYADTIISFISSAYLVVVLFNCFKLIFQYSSGLSLKTDLLPANESITNQVLGLSKKMEIRNKVSVWLSEKIFSPLTTGVIKPMILLPAELVTQLNASQLEAIIVHELYHIRRNDYLLNLMLVFSEVILFFNPFALLLSSIVRKERENSCDDKVIQMEYDAWDYSKALFTISSHNPATSDKLILAAAGSHKKILLARIKRMMDLAQPTPSIIKPATAFFLCLSVAFFSIRGTPKKLSTLPEPNSAEITSTRMLLYRPEPVVIATIDIRKKEEVVLKHDNKEVPKAKESSAKATSQDVNTKGNLLVNEYYSVPMFIINDQKLEFTFIIPGAPEIPQPVARETPLPYVPGSTFYFPVDSLHIAGTKSQPIRI